MSTIHLPVLRTIAGYAAREGDVFSRHLIEYCEELAEDREMYERSLAHAQTLPEFVEASRLFAEAETASEETPFSERLASLLERAEPERRDGIVRLLASEIIHREKWNEVERKYADVWQSLLKER